ncbi:hypothetical protein GUITHDRAFT_121878 [Guillardia theta CCMP2712]|uniref:Uncharacterized protein n=1 Tax=Guillardia theta (strain CCMP2712) TaxID=905079 RepID=L1I6R4_GUITC|nr:hypothetical protein GUITHDRAFT_121878 [Guillardia theta CCMP2712]EKX31948.1 hypothetical protein GUITHDRAFT_121878 [Guillardia theta CCMP2712]|eukprot:XP_005818928.1 hypothetical protein GUITHDRAFT_121878 [Guillardia theta CCMP2712]
MSSALRTFQWAFLGSDHGHVTRTAQEDMEDAEEEKPRGEEAADDEEGEEMEEGDNAVQKGEEGQEGLKLRGKSFFSLARSMSQDNLESIKISAHVTKKVASTLGSSLTSSIVITVRAFIFSLLNFFMEFRNLLSFGIDARIESLQARMLKVEEEQQDMKGEIASLRCQVEELRRRMDGEQAAQ